MVNGCKNLRHTQNEHCSLFIRPGYNTARWWHGVAAFCLKVISMLSTKNPINIPQPQPLELSGMRRILTKHIAATVNFMPQSQI